MRVLAYNVDLTQTMSVLANIQPTVGNNVGHAEYLTYNVKWLSEDVDVTKYLTFSILKLCARMGK